MYSDSPVFVREEIIDRGSDFLITNNSISLNKTAKVAINNLTGIDSINYVSNGLFLNTTLWFTKPLDNQSKKAEPYFNIYIDSDYDNATGYHGTDYVKSVYRDGNHWNEYFAEYSSSNNMRFIKDNVVSNFSNYFDIEGNSIFNSIDLKDINYPEKYKIAFQIEYTNFTNLPDDEFVYDSTSWIPIPEPNFSISSDPNIVYLRPGEEKIITFTINSTSDLQPTASFRIENSYDDMIQTTLPIYKMTLPQFGSTFLKMSVASNEIANPGSTYNIRFVSEFDLHLERDNVSSKKIQHSSILIVNILNPVTFDDYYKDLNNLIIHYGVPLKESIAVLTPIIGALGFLKILNRRKKGRRKKLKNDD